MCVVLFECYLQKWFLIQIILAESLSRDIGITVSLILQYSAVNSDLRGHKHL